MKIAYVTTYDVLNKQTWPRYQLGLGSANYYIAKSLEQQSVAIEYIGPLQKNFSLLTRTKWSFYRYFFKKDYYRWAEPLVLKDYGKQIAKKLANSNADIVLCPENAAPIAYLQCQQPMVLWIDTTLAAMIDFYPYLSNLCAETKRNIYALEKSTFEKCKLLIFSSEWAAKTAINIYGINPDKVKVVPWGGNIECDRTITDIQHIVESRAKNPCKLLFIGTQWQRKGGNIALAVAKELNQMGLPTELTVVGCESSVIDEPLPSFVKFLGFIDKFTQEGEQIINQLFTESHFLILPTQAETYGHVFCEANSFAVPCLATNVGGIPTIIKDGVNGKIFTLDASPLYYSKYIASLMNHYSSYKQIAMSSFKEYESQLNWAINTQIVQHLLDGLI